MAVVADSVTEFTTWSEEAAKTPQRWLFLLAFFSIYVIWGSTYLAIRYAVESIPPLLTAGVRHLTAGAILYLWARTRGPAPTLRQWKAAIVLGALFFLVGHGSLHWAEQFVPSGLAALLVATEPIFIVLLVALLRSRSRPCGIAIVGMLVGLIGVGLLMGRDALGASRAELMGAAAVVLGAFSWAAGMLYARSSQLPRDSVMSAAASMLTGAVMLLLAGLPAGEYSRLSSDVSAKALFSLGYLIIFGSLLAFTAYVWLLEHYSPALVATHTYVNPVIAVLLGWTIGSEPLSPRILLASALIVGAVVMVSRGTREEKKP
jgi:drug/metabolite transporter (DMT)-like permease